MHYIKPHIVTVLCGSAIYSLTFPFLLKYLYLNWYIRATFKKSLVIDSTYQNKLKAVLGSEFRPLILIADLENTAVLFVLCIDYFLICA